jgi:hypothetical protein
MLNLYERQYRTSPRTNNSLQQQQEMRLFRANRSSVEPKNDNDSKNNLKSTMVKESNESKNQQLPPTTTRNETLSSQSVQCRTEE